ncbi:MAG: hypothetical protein J6Q85_00830 [Clostridia bacterium]|nr:hypothetical protein [Clostridia bacterium]
MDITQIDKNLKVDREIDKTGLVFKNIDEEPFRIYGVFRDGETYSRLPLEVAEATSENVKNLRIYTAGGRIRFVTDSARVAIIVTYVGTYNASHMPLSGSTGLDLYVDGSYMKTFIPPYGMNYGFESVADLGTREKRLITINMPTYSRPAQILVGIEEGAAIERAPDYTYEKPIVYYGSSITQGGCASRAGTNYPAIVSRKLDSNHVNLGFSGSAKGEDAMADYIAGLDMSVFVYDYDHNAPTVEHLRDTHERMFLKIREKQPDLPVIMISRPYYRKTENRDARFEVIKQTYENALKRGDKNVYLIHGGEIFGDAENECTVDDCHLTDLGFYMMAKAVYPVIKKIFDER